MNLDKTTDAIVDVRYALDSSKIKSNLGWIPKENFESGILKTVQWYLANILSHCP